MSGFGQGPFGIGPFGLPYLVPGPGVDAALSSSRQIDGSARKYVINAEGGFAPMDDIAQRVLLLLSFGVDEPSLITPQTKADMEQQTRAALAPLSSGPEPAIRIVSIDVTDDGKDGVSTSLRYVDLLTGTQQTVTS